MASDESLVSAAAAMYQEQVPSYKHLDEPLDEGRFVLERILDGILQTFTSSRPQLFHVQDTLDCTLHAFVWLNLFPENSVFLFIPSNLLRGFILGIALSWTNPKLISLALS